MKELITTVIVGAGQAGLSLSYFLKQSGQEHVVLDKANQPGDAWRNQRWDSFTLVTPNWTFRLPGAEYQGDDPNGFMNRDEIVRRFEAYPAQHHLPLRFGCEVSRVEPLDGRGYIVHTPQGEIAARNVVIATGSFQTGKIPDYAANLPASIVQIHTNHYRSPGALPDGTVLVVGSGQSGMQIAEELYQAGRRVILSTGGSPRVPRRYRGKDIFDWLYLSGFLDHTLDTFPLPAGRRFVPPSITGKNGGHTLNLHCFFRDQVTLVGRVSGYENGRLLLAQDLHQNLASTDRSEEIMLDMIDAFIKKSGIDAPEEKIVKFHDADVAPEQASLDLKRERISVIIWAGGFQPHFPIAPAGLLDEKGVTLTRRSATHLPGLYFLGSPFVPRLKSAFLVGVSESAQIVAHEIGGKA